MDRDQRLRILLVEDDPDDVWIMRSLLADHWECPFELIHVELLSAALERCLLGGIDIILLDLTLPDCRGLETFLLVYAQAGDIPIVVLTGLADQTAAIKAVQAGAQDFLIKGQVDDNILVRSIRYAIERNKRHLAEEALRITNEEFRIAQQIQKRLFPVRAPVLPGFEIGGAVFPATATAGDYFDYIPMNDGSLSIVVGDVSGHGMGPAMVMAETRACLRALSQTYHRIDDILNRANLLLLADSDELHFVTLAMFQIDASTRSLIYASAGQRGYILDVAGNAHELDSTSLPLGIDPDLKVPVAPPIVLQPGELVTFFTDGVVEAEAPNGIRFGATRALELLHRVRHLPAREIVDQLYRSISDFCRPYPRHDDVTVVVVKVL